ncbi:MAG: hypothetical protein ABI165_15850 [Bryobacteraceae bacterium]
MKPTSGSDEPSSRPMESTSGQSCGSTASRRGRRTARLKRFASEWNPFHRSFLPGAFPNRVHGFGERKFAGDPARRFDETFGRPCRGRPAQSGGERFSSIDAKRMQHDLVESGRAYLGDAAIEQRTCESAARRGERNRAAVR